MRHSETCYYKDRISYTGNLNYTVNGISCQPWSKNPFINNITYPTLINNYCRNPQGTGLKPWCYTNHDRREWDYCLVEQCLDGNYIYVLFDFLIVSFQFMIDFVIK